MQIIAVNAVSLHSDLSLQEESAIHHDMAQNLLIFIDGLPYYYLARTQFLNAFSNKKSVSPGLGFSVNIKPEMYSGLTPDEIGFFGEYGLRNSPPTAWLESLSRLHFMRRWPKIDRFVHKVFIKLGFDVLNIPFGYLPYFERTKSKVVYAHDFPFPTVFTEAQIEYVAAERMKRDYVSRDRKAYQTALTRLGEVSSLHVSFIGIDEAGHTFGVGTAAYDRALIELDRWVEELSIQFQRSHRDGNIVVFSDHGMANVTSAVTLELEQHLGPSNSSTYLYFADSVMLRVWVRNPLLFTQIVSLLEQTGNGTILNQSHRRDYGATAEYCGDIIFILDEGKVISPNYFGLKEPKAMHGYLPNLESQQAVLLASGPGIKEELFSQVRNTRDLYSYLSGLCQD